MRPSKTTLISVSSLTLSFLAITLAVTFSPNSIFASPVNEEWVHYNKVDASTTQKGIKEYWVSCSSHTNLFSAPTNGTITEGGTPASQFINSLPDNDERLIKPYSKLFDFNDGVNSYISIYDGFNSLSLVDNEGIDGSKALKASFTGTGGKDSHLRIDKGYLDYVFSDPEIKALSFYAKGTVTTNNFRHIKVDASYVNNNNEIISCYERNNTGYGIANTYKQFLLTRGVYSQMGDSDWFIQYGASGPYDLYLDNFALSYTDCYDYNSRNGLENGYATVSGTNFYLRNPVTAAAQFQINGSALDTTSVGPNYEKHTEGERSIAFKKNSGYLSLAIKDQNGGNPTIPDEGILFDFYSTVDFNGWWSSGSGAILDGTNGRIVSQENESIRNGKWHTFHFKKSQITADGRFLILQGSPTGTVYIDNIRLATNELTSFENVGAFHVDCFSDANDGHAGASKFKFENTEANIKACTNSGVFLFSCRWKAATGAEITTERASHGLYSLKLTKKAEGTMEVNPEYVKMMGDEDVLVFDAYTDDMSRLTATTMAGHTLTLKKGEWTTLSLSKADITESTGRFTTNAFGAGTIYIDNIRISHYSSYSNMGQAHYSPSTGLKIKTSSSIDEFVSVSIDGNTAFVRGVSGNEVEIDQSPVTEGIHLATVSYIHDNHHLCEHIYFEPVAFADASSGINISVAYGANTYYTLSGYSNVYRMMVGEHEFPYEVSSSNYLLPHAALVQMLPESNNQKVSGTVKLKIFTTNGNHIVPINVTLSGTATMKAIPNYQGDGIATHAYSSTNSQASRSDYESYLGIDKVVEFQNTGLEMMYEQAIQIGRYETALSDAEAYLFDNAAKLNQKVMVVDLCFTVLSKYNTSIIGVDLLESVDTDGNPTGNKFAHQYIPKVGDNYRFSTTDDLDAFVEHRLGIYMNHPACFGVNVGDEQTYKMLNGGFKDLMASIKRVKTKLNREDFYVNANLQPLSTSDAVLTGVTPSGTVSDAQHEANYKTYLNAFVANSGLDYIQFDAYPFASSDKDNIYEKKGLNYFYMRNLLIVAEYCKTNNLDMYFVTQAVTYYGTRILNRADIAWINNMALGLGVKHISYFVYCVRAVTGSETWIDNSSFLDVDGNRTDLYYYFQSQIHEINAFAPVISSFDYEWMHLYKYNLSYNSAKIYSKTTSSASYPSSSTYGELTNVSTTRDWVLATGLRNKTDNKYMYMVQNVYNSFSAELLQTITMTFNQNYEYAVIYESGLPRVVSMGAKTLQIKLSAGRAAYVMVY